MAINILSTYPANGAVGVLIDSRIEVLFDAPIDPASIGEGTLFLEGSDKEVPAGGFVPIRYPGVGEYQEPYTDPAYHGITRGSYTYDYQDVLGSSLGTSFTDTSGNTVYNTKVTFIPTYPLSTLHTYTLRIVGTISTNYLSGIYNRTVFDPITDTGNTGNGYIKTLDSYNGTTTSTYHVEMIDGGIAGVATYHWKKDSASYSAKSLTHNYAKKLSNGVSVLFGLDGTYAPGDKFTFLVKPATSFLSGITSYEFTTGNAGTQAGATDTSLISQAPVYLPSNLSPGLVVDYTIPIELSCGLLNTNSTSIKLVFNKPLSNTYDTNGMIVYIGAPNGDPSIRSETSYHPNNISISGSEMTINLQNT